MTQLILSLFPGIGLLDMAFEEQGFCVVRGPDVLWGGDIKRFHPPAGRFDGVIGGPPCKGESKLAHLNGNVGASLAEEFFRVVKEAAPRWWVMEAVKQHEAPYAVKLSPRYLGEPQSRVRWFHSNLPLARYIEVELFESPEFAYAVRASNRASSKGTVRRRMASYSIADMKRLQGLPVDFDIQFATVRGKEEMIGNGVPLPLGRAIAKAVRDALLAPQPEVGT